MTLQNECDNPPFSYTECDPRIWTAVTLGDRPL